MIQDGFIQLGVIYSGLLYGVYAAATFDSRFSQESLKSLSSDEFLFLTFGNSVKFKISAMIIETSKNVKVLNNCVDLCAFRI